MRTRFRFVITLLLCLQSLSPAAALSPAADSVADCAFMNLKEESVGTVCKAHPENLFKRVKIGGYYGIQDLAPNGKVWFDSIWRGINQHDAQACGRKPGQRLPTIAEFQLAESRGIRNVFKGDMSSLYFWTSSKYKNDPDFFYIFFGYTGDVGYDHYSRDYNYYVSRCVRR